MEVTTTDLGQVGDLIDIAIAAGANQVQGVSFTLKDRDQYKQQAIDKALADARSKAEGAVKKLGTEITGVRHVVIQEGNNPPPVIYKSLDRGMAPAAGAAEATPVLPGSFAFRVSVQVEFGLK